MGVRKTKVQFLKILERVPAIQIISKHFPIMFSDGKICLKGASNKYISAQPEGTVSCDKDEVGDWEKFEWLTVYTNPEKKVCSEQSHLKFTKVT